MSINRNLNEWCITNSRTKEIRLKLYTSFKTFSMMNIEWSAQKFTIPKITSSVLVHEKWQPTLCARLIRNWALWRIMIIFYFLCLCRLLVKFFFITDKATLQQMNKLARFDHFHRLYVVQSKFSPFWSYKETSDATFINLSHITLILACQSLRCSFFRKQGSELIFLSYRISLVEWQILMWLQAL